MKLRLLFLLILYVFSSFCGRKTDQIDPEKRKQFCYLLAIDRELNPQNLDLPGSLKQISTAEYLALCHYTYKK